MRTIGETNKILIQRQPGFRREHSYETPLNLVLAKWIAEIEHNRKVDAVFLNLKTES